MAREKFKTKLSKKQKRNNIQVFIAVAVCLYIFTLLFNRYVIKIFDSWSTFEIYTISVAMVFFLCSMTLTPTLLIGLILGYQKGKAKRVRDDSTFVSLQNIEYYRENLGKLEPAIVSLLVDLDIYGEKDIVATLLRMKNKGVITFGENGKIFLTGKNKNRLSESEKELLDFIAQDKHGSKKNILWWKQNRFREAETLGYIKKKETVNGKMLLKGTGVGVLSFFMAIFLWSAFLAIDVFEKSYSVGWMILVFLWLLMIDVLIFTPFYLLARMVGYKRRGDVLWERTEIGNEMAEKAAGLARYIQDFTLLSEREKEEAILWDDYLVYAIVLEENEKIVKDISKSYSVDLGKVEKTKIR